MHVRTGWGTSLIVGSSSDPWESGEAVALTWFQAMPPLFLLAMWKGQLRADCPRVFPETVTLGGQ